MKTLWLASWYHNKISPYNGDFIMRHAQAACLYEEVQVIHIVKDEKGIVTKDTRIEESKNGQLAEMIIYYHVKKLHSFFKQARECMEIQTVIPESYQSILTDQYTCNCSCTRWHECRPGCEVAQQDQEDSLCPYRTLDWFPG